MSHSYSESDEPSSADSASDSKNSDEPDYKEEYQISFASYQVFTFVGCFAAYCVLLYNRQALAFTLPHILTEKYLSTYDVGLIIRAQTMTYAVSRFLCSVATDNYSPRVMLTSGLFLTGFIMLALPDLDGSKSLILLAASNGVAQGLGWPAIVKIIRAWYPPTQFGLWFALVGSATHCTIGLGPGLATAISVHHGWRTAIHLPAILAIASAPIIMMCSWDKPSDVGYEDQLTLGGAELGHWSDLAGSEFLLILVSIFSCVHIAKSSCIEYGQAYLVDERHVPYYISSSFFASFEAGGMFGSILLGGLTDFLIRRGYYLGTGKSPRMIIVQVCVAGSCLFLSAFIFSPDPETSKVYIQLVGFSMGFCMYGTIGLICTIAVEVAPIHITGTAYAIVGLAANIAGLLGGCTQYIAELWGWSTAFMIINIMCLLAFMLVVIGKNRTATFLEEAVGGPPKIRKIIK